MPPDPLAPEANAAQWKNWNEISGPKWVRLGSRMEARFGDVNELLLARAAPQPGEHVLEIGCGLASTTLPLAERVGAGGHVLGVDLSEPMLAVAQERVAGLTQVTLLRADAQVHAFPQEHFDLVASRFGVMFFADPVAAFANIRRALRPGGRVCCAAWADIADNPHWEIPLAVALRHLGPPKPHPPRTPGPLAFSDRDYVRSILDAAGFDAVAVTIAPVFLHGTSIAEEAELACLIGPSGALVAEKRPDAATLAALQAEIAAALTAATGGNVLRLAARLNMIEALRRH